MPAVTSRRTSLFIIRVRGVSVDPPILDADRRVLTWAALRWCSPNVRNEVVGDLPVFGISVAEAREQCGLLVADPSADYRESDQRSGHQRKRRAVLEGPGEQHD